MIHEEKGNDGQLVADFSSPNATLQQMQTLSSFLNRNYANGL